MQHWLILKVPVQSHIPLQSCKEMKDQQVILCNHLDKIQNHISITKLTYTTEIFFTDEVTVYKTKAFFPAFAWRTLTPEVNI